MTSPSQQAKALGDAIERQRLAHDTMRETARQIARERQAETVGAEEESVER